jgi:hypothetical protein
MIKKHQRNTTGFISKLYYAYFGVTLEDQNKSRKKSWVRHCLYLNLPAALHPLVHGPEVSVAQPTEILEDASNNSSDSGGDDEEFQFSQIPQLFTQSELNHVIRDSGLPKEKAELLGSRLKEKNLLEPGTSMYW